MMLLSLPLPFLSMFNAPTPSSSSSYIPGFYASPRFFHMLQVLGCTPSISSSHSSTPRLLAATKLRHISSYSSSKNISFHENRHCHRCNHPTAHISSTSAPSSSFGDEDEFGPATDEGDDDDDDEEEDDDDGHVFPRHYLAFPQPPQLSSNFTSCTSSTPLPDRWDVLGLGQAMVDFSGMVDDDFLERLGLEKGTRKLVNHEERGQILRAMDGCSYKAAAGGSLSNTLVALARLGGHSIGGPPLNIAMAGSVGTDPLGGFYRSKLKRANVSFLSTLVETGTTGTVIVLTTPDAQRTMLAHQGTSSAISYDSSLATSICKANILVVEGYLFELPDTIKTITRACEDARRSGALVAVTASDVSCIERHYDDFWDIMANYADIVFANTDEARTLCDFSDKESPVSATRYLSHFIPLVSVTDGARGSYIGAKGEAVYIPPSPCVPVDTCGAGDAYASGILYGVLRGVSDLKGLGALASKVASVVVGQQGTRLRVQDAVAIAKSFTCSTSSSMSSDVGSDQISSL
ncbi:OLC1v1024116C1 [Oldenlandia corymbosa var. corymbosa]|uniref:OLC1v1024116C1 n=1 Tax=Oldenlandia corymbosa var. corymbosa TaxID=529605 RepID=A0AAV1C4D7_OLDCO|nr:OLC1v1024116C1 [Oldenlandia corymbosa var. corymbosa]